LGIALLLVIVATISASSFQGTYAYRELVHNLNSRATELPPAIKLSRKVSDLRVTLADLDDVNKFPDWKESMSFSRHQLETAFDSQFAEVKDAAKTYATELAEHEHGESQIGDPGQEHDILGDIQELICKVEQLTAESDWYQDPSNTRDLTSALETLQGLAAELPENLQRHMHALVYDVRSRYRTWIVLTWICSAAAGILLILFMALCYRWVFRPLRVLVKGSRQVAAGDFNFRIELPKHDEIGELAEAMNDMTARFCAIRDDLDKQVQIRTKQVVRSEQLASVGFLAAGVAHEINNPLASIALCAESLESRLAEMAPPDSPQCEVVSRYLKMIQTEAFRCKEITEKLLDFSRMGEVKRASADLGELIQGVIDMVRHVGKYQDRKIEFAAGQPVIATVNAQEIKQVVLNLITNALDSLDASGTLRIELARKPDFAEMIFTDNGCGMTEEVLKHLFEPFFTRKRGGQGTGLGLSIVYRIVSEHGGQIEATSAGPGRGAQFHVTLPLTKTTSQSISPQKETSHRYQAA
jgi:signal transduction histidine kinase